MNFEPVKQFLDTCLPMLGIPGSDTVVYKDGKEIKLIRSVKIYHYKNFLYMETSHSMFIIKNTDFISGDREGLLNWAKIHNIRVLFGY